MGVLALYEMDIIKLEYFTLLYSNNHSALLIYAFTAYLTQGLSLSDTSFALAHRDRHGAFAP